MTEEQKKYQKLYDFAIIFFKNAERVGVSEINQTFETMFDSWSWKDNSLNVSALVAAMKERKHGLRYEESSMRSCYEYLITGTEYWAADNEMPIIIYEDI